MAPRRRFSTYVPAMRMHTVPGFLFLIVIIVAIVRFEKQPRHMSFITSRSGPARRPRNGAVYKFFQAGSQALHVTNTTCPVPWEWTDDRESADAVWYDILQRPFPSFAE